MAASSDVPTQKEVDQLFVAQGERWDEYLRLNREVKRLKHIDGKKGEVARATVQRDIAEAKWQKVYCLYYQRKSEKCSNIGIMDKKTVVLERAQEKDGRLGSFGFSVLGGHGTKYPAVVCEVESGGPAHLSKMVQVGDRLLELNGEVLMELTSKDLVQRIRMAPSPSTFTMGEDETLRQQVLALLRKQERRAAVKPAVAASGLGDGESGEDPRSKKNSLSSLPGEERRRKRIIEVEPSVNIVGGQNTDIVQVRDNKIIGRRVDQPLLSPDHVHSQGSRENSPFRQYQSPGRHHSPSPSTGSGSGKRTRTMDCSKTTKRVTAILQKTDMLDVSFWVSGSSAAIM